MRASARIRREGSKNSVPLDHSRGAENTDNIKAITPSAIEWLGSQVRPGEYVVRDDQSDFPKGIAWCNRDNHSQTVFLGTCYTRPTTGSSTELMPAPGTVMYFQKTTRECCHNGTPHQNADINVYWTAQNGCCYRANAGTSPDHYRSLLTGSSCLAIDSWLASGSTETGPLVSAGLSISVRITSDGPRSDY